MDGLGETFLFFSFNRLTFLQPVKLHSSATLAWQHGSSERHIGVHSRVSRVHNSGQGKTGPLDVFVSQAQPSLGR